MSMVDWSLAPEGATHKDVTPYGLWYRFDLKNNVVCYWNTRAWTKSGTPKQYDDGSLDHMEERPKQPQAWSGPEDGLPPVGTACEFRSVNASYLSSFVAVEVLCYGREHCFLRHAASANEFTAKTDHIAFRATKTPEQISADKRETAIRELMDIAQVDCRVTAARLVDAGFKREGK